MSIDVRVPHLPESVADATVVTWHKKVGDSVEIGEILAEIETDKATMEMEAFDDGVLTEILVPEGGTVPIGALLAVLNGDSGSPRVTGSMSVSRSHLRVGSQRTAFLRPPPFLRTRPSGSTRGSLNSFTPLAIVSRHTEVAREISDTPPYPMAMAPAATTSRLSRSFSTG